MRVLREIGVLEDCLKMSQDTAPHQIPFRFLSGMGHNDLIFDVSEYYVPWPQA